MESLQSVCAQLAQQLTKISPTSGEIVRLQASTNEKHDVLAWLKAQQALPQFYFGLRDSTKTYGALGAARQFDALESAQSFITQHQFPLFGGLTFNGEAYFFLPQLLWEQDEQGLTISLFVDRSRILDAENSLKTLLYSAPLAPVQSVILTKQAKADKAQWQQWVNRALSQIAEDAVTKLVLANETEYGLNEALNPYDLLAQSRQTNQGCYHFLWRPTADFTFVGSTPERLFARQGAILRTEALAGTAPIGENWKNWLLQDEKNILENQLVVDDISANLAPWIETLAVSELNIKPLRNVQHLQRDIQATLKSTCLDAQLLQQIHPTAAVAGLPQQSAKAQLQQIETFERGWYAGTLGLLQQASAEFCVTIRSALITDKSLRVFAGAGIVAGSDPEAEWLEIERKAAGLVSLLQNNGEEK